jgi:hypothetical protein
MFAAAIPPIHTRYHIPHSTRTAPHIAASRLTLPCHTSLFSAPVPRPSPRHFSEPSHLLIFGTRHTMLIDTPAQPLYTCAAFPSLVVHAVEVFCSRKPDPQQRWSWRSAPMPHASATLPLRFPAMPNFSSPIPFLTRPQLLTRC